MDFKYDVKSETKLKALILTHGVVFTDKALSLAKMKNAKGQNLIYNKPQKAEKNRPQELLLQNLTDGYKTVVSCVSPSTSENAVVIDAIDDKLFLQDINSSDVAVSYVREPSYYRQLLTNGEYVKNYVSACGLDELNIFPWKGCSISRCCKFCGSNNFVKADTLNAHEITQLKWNELKIDYLSNLREAIDMAKLDDCYSHHMHVILIAGNLSNNLLDLESQIFIDITENIHSIIKDKATEGIVLVITPPRNLDYLKRIRQAGVEKVVFNLEAIQPNFFEIYCPGKNDLGYNYFIERLKASVSIFGKGNVWSNLVFGLEPYEDTLALCEDMAKMGIVMGANVLHMDEGNQLDCSVPSAFEAIDFFWKLEHINSSYGFYPFYCSQALRTSLSNEAHDNRIVPS